MARRIATYKPKRPRVRIHGPTRQQTRALHTGSKAWRQLREQILQRDRFTCRECNRYGAQVDHADGDSHNNDPGNLQTLCISCHSSKTAKEQNDGRTSSTSGKG